MPPVDPAPERSAPALFTLHTPGAITGGLVGGGGGGGGEEAGLLLLLSDNRRVVHTLYGNQP